MKKKLRPFLMVWIDLAVWFNCVAWVASGSSTMEISCFQGVGEPSAAVSVTVTVKDLLEPDIIGRRIPVNRKNQRNK